MTNDYDPYDPLNPLRKMRDFGADRMGRAMDMWSRIPERLRQGAGAVGGAIGGIPGMLDAHAAQRGAPVGIAPGVRREPERAMMPPAVRPSPQAELADYGLGGDVSTGPVPQMPQASLPGALRAAPASTGGTGQVTTTAGAGPSHAPSAAAYSGAPQAAPVAPTAGGNTDANQRMRAAILNWQMGLGGLGAKEEEAQQILDLGENIGKNAKGQRMDWASQASRGLAGIGQAYGQTQAQDLRAQGRRDEAFELANVRRQLAQLRGGKSEDELPYYQGM